jgi:hypothetical protein
MKDQLLSIIREIDDPEIAGAIAKAAKSYLDAFIEQGFSRDEALQMLASTMKSTQKGD